MRNTDWHEYDEGFSVGTVGAQDGAIIRDEEHDDGARMTLEEDASAAPFAVTCAIYGWLLHTRYFSDEYEATDEFDKMKLDLEELVETMPASAETDEERLLEFAEQIAEFVETYP